MRYCGSKARFAKDIIPIITEHLDDGVMFYDAFMGGANIISRVEHPLKTGIELNTYIYELWKKILNDTLNEKDIREWLPFNLTREEYNQAREAYTNADYSLYKPYMIGFIGSACSYGGAWFNGYAGFNPKKNEDHIKEACNGLIKQVKDFKYLKETDFYNISYNEIEDFHPMKGCVIYCDPPYESTKKYETDFDNRKFWHWARAMSENNHVYVSEYTAPDDFECIWEKKKKDGMGTTKTGEKQSEKTEKLFVYKKKKITFK